MNKTNLCALIIAVLIFSGDPCSPSSAQRPDSEPYRVIFNCDGHSVFGAANGDHGAWIQNIFGPLEGSHVDALFWCDGAGGNTANYDSDVLELNGARIGAVNPILLQWIEQGNDPPRSVVQEGHKRGLDVYYSFRMNDIHDGYLPQEFATFKKEHPEWILGKGEIDTSQGRHAIKAKHPDEVYFSEYATSLNFAVPEVRELKLRIIQEIFDKYDFDGLEIDLMRFPRYFAAYLEFRSAYILTDFLRVVRQRLNERAEQRGRPIKLAVRVDENLVACQLDGFDVATWVNESLVDSLIVGDSAFSRGQDIQAFKKLVEGKPVHVYACNGCIQQSFRNAQGETPEVRRGLAANFWQQGVDGIYTFNWFPHEPKLAYQTDLLKEIGDPRVLATKDKTFSADCSEYGPGAKHTHPSSPRMHNWRFAPLPVTLYPVWSANSFTEIDVDVADDLSGVNREKVKSVQLWLQLSNLVPDDVIEFRFNGQPLSPLPKSETGQESENEKLVKFSLATHQLQVGRNQVGVRLSSRGATAETDIVFSTAEIHVDYD